MYFHPYNASEEQEYERIREDFFEQNTREDLQDKNETHSVDFDGYVPSMMVVLSNSSDNSTSRPWWMAYWCYALCSVFLMTIPYRLALYRATSFQRWNVTKHFSQNAEEMEEPLYSSKKSKLARIVEAGQSLSTCQKEADDDRQCSL